MSGEKSAIDAVASEIIGYLCTHPEAADSVSGIHRWWLQSKFSTEHSWVVEQALSKLVEAGVVRVRLLSDGTRVYGSNERNPSTSRKCTENEKETGQDK